ncbi:glycosyl hydrolase family 3 N terminal domain-containing protein [Aspergillus sergii]|uniref:beta-glucosidase n=1 Tax=Aspergillus sergii TaxID=1034303 RepID=A0A5N6WLY4_9EURO|nr:glycosyl hydrolase family 3 N terminal domain-containing protein [Aspergillus sergii]
MASHNPVNPDIKFILSKLTLDEEISLVAGADFWTTHPVPRLGIPALKVSDGPNGARGENFKGSITSACFPASVSLASTFDGDLAENVGKALAEETVTKGARVLLGPTVCPHGDPRGGRNFESFSEDPYLAGELASHYITGVQRKGIAATIKHYARNEQETRLFTINALVSERALREIYLKPFKIAVKNSDPWALMTSFNLVNGEHSDSNKHLLDILRQWGFNGLVMSDWESVNSAAGALNAGRQAPKESCFSNENNILPIRRENVQSVALLGLAKQFLGHGGGSASLNSHRKITPYEAFQEALSSSVELRYAEGAKAIRNLPPFSEGVDDDVGNPSFTLNVFGLSDVDGNGTTSRVATSAFQSNENPDTTSATMTGIFKPSVTGNHYLGFSAVVPRNSPDAMAFLLDTAVEEKKQYQFTAGEKYKIRIEAKSAQDTTSGLQIYASNIVGFNLGFMYEQEHDADLLSEAVQLAQSSEIAIVFANSNTIVVNSTGTPITMPWLADVSAVIKTWFPGQEAGHSIADVVLGIVNPGGKLPVTLPKSVADNPSYGNFPGDLETLTVPYKEDVFIGYRHFDRRPEGVQFPYGFGLSYTTFKKFNPNASGHCMDCNNGLTITVDVENTGSVAGSEVVQVYAGPTSVISSLDRPNKELAGFAKVKFQPEESKQVSIFVGKDAVAYRDEMKDAWSVDAGTYRIYIGTDISCTLDFKVESSFSYGP